MNARLRNQQGRAYHNYRRLRQAHFNSDMSERGRRLNIRQSRRGSYWINVYYRLLDVFDQRVDRQSAKP
jgi:hypothetical protein